MDTVVQMKMEEEEEEGRNRTCSEQNVLVVGGVIEGVSRMLVSSSVASSF